MSNFKIGQKVVFVHNDGCVYDTIEVGTIVKINRICCDGWIEVEQQIGIEYESHHFRPLDDSQTEEILSMMLAEKGKSELTLQEV